MSESAPRNDLDPSGFFVLRTPLLPFEELESWSADLQAPAVDDDERLGEALAEDRRRLRERLLELLERPVVREALFVASPSLLSGLAAWRADPDSKKGRRAEEALVRYLFRMTTRATPFGLFSGCSIGETGADSRLRLQRRRAYRRHTRLDMGYLAALAEALEKESALRRRLRYRPNSSLYRAAGRLRYAESKLAGQQRSYHLVAVETAPYLERVLRRAGRGATPRELAQDLVRSGIEDVSVEEALEFIGELIDSELLVTSLSPNVTGSEPIHDLIEQIGERQAPVTTLLEEVRDSLARLDGEGPGARTESYRTVARRLEELPAEVELPRLFQVDLFKPVDVATLGPRVFDEVRRGVDLLHRLAGPAEDGALSRFCQDFTARYEESQPVPLVEVLDEELGIGFDAAPGADASPLLDGLALPPRHGEVSVRWGSRARLLLAKLQEATAAGAREIRLQVADLESFPHRGLPPLPDAFQVTVTLAAASEEAMNDGDFQLYLRGAGGPSGARLLGRFCHPEDRLRSRVEGHLRQEEALQPDAVFAEIAHLPEGRVGNVLCRPVLRDYEIPFLGRSGADPSRQIPITDLDVSVSGQTIELRSRRLGRRVIPRLTNAHNFSARSLGIYRFLCSLQHQGVRPGLGWAWGALDGLAFLPRVTFGRVLLSRATWRVEPREVEDLARAAGAERFKAVQLWRGERQLPRRVVLVEGDNELLIDLDNVLSIDTFIALARRSPRLTLTELFPAPEQLGVRGPEGRFFNELVIPFVRRREVRARPKPAPALRAVARRTFAPGSEWLYAKLYTGAATADQVLRRVVAPVTREALTSGAADRWFFVRYGDPHWHLRLRLHGDPRRLQREVATALQDAASPLIEDRLIWRLQFDTYTRELERYGGSEGIVLAERLAHADSEAVLAIVGDLEGDAGADERWRLALYGIDRLLSDLAFDAAPKLDLLGRLQESFARELRVGPGLKKQLAARLRQERRDLEAMLELTPASRHPLAPFAAAFERRSGDLAPIAAELRSRAASERLTAPLADLAVSFVHMFNNRLLRSDARAHEMVLYDFLYRLYRSQAARARHAEPGPASAAAVAI